MSKVPSLRDILDDIQDDVSDSDEGEFETIEVEKPVQKKPLLDIPDEYKVLNKPRIKEDIQYNNNNNYNNNVYYNNQYVNNKKQNYNKQEQILQLTEENLMKVSGESMVSYDISKYESIETKTLKTKKSVKSVKSHISSESHKSNKSESSIDFSVGDDNKNRYISYSYAEEDDDVRSQISSLSAGSIKSGRSYVEKEPIKLLIKKCNDVESHRVDNQSLISRISKKSHISISSMGSMESKATSIQKSIRDDKPLIQSLYPKRIEQSRTPMVMAFDKFSNQTKEEEKVKIDVKRIKNIDEFKTKINHYIKLDDEINALMQGLRERKKEKEQYEKELLLFMKENEIDSIKSKSDNSQIELVHKKKTEGLSKEYLLSSLNELLKNKSTSENIVNYIYSKRVVIKSEKIKRIIEGGKEKRKINIKI